MSFTINTAASDAIVAIALVIEDLNAAAKHQLAPDAYKARKALAGYIRDKKAELEALLKAVGGASAALMELVAQAINLLRLERSEAAKARREYAERMAAERALLEGMLAA